MEDQAWSRDEILFPLTKQGIFPTNKKLFLGVKMICSAKASPVSQCSDWTGSGCGFSRSDNPGVVVEGGALFPLVPAEGGAD